MMKTKPWPDVPTSRCAHNVVRAAVLLQLLSIFPLVCGVIRGQLFTYLLGTIYPGALPVFLLNLCLVSGSSLVASLFPNAPGQVLGLVGAVSGTLYVCLLPILVHLAALGEQGRRVSRGGPTSTSQGISQSTAKIHCSQHQRSNKKIRQTPRKAKESRG